MLAVLCTASTWWLATAVARADAPPLYTVAPSIPGTAVQGVLLTADPGTWTGDDPITYTYQWSDGQTGQSITPSAGDVGQPLSVTVTATDVNGQWSQATSNSDTVLPANGSVPIISGTPQQDHTLTVSTGSWNNGASSFSYQWYDCDSSGNNCEPITNVPDASTSSYTVQASDVTRTVLAVVTDNASGISAASGADGPILPPAPVDQVAPGISSASPQQGVPLSVSTGTWTHSPKSYQYLWQDCASATTTNCSAIANTNSSTYTPGQSDVGQWLSVQVTAINGGVQGTVTTASVGPVQPAPVTTQTTTQTTTTPAPSTQPAQVSAVSTPTPVIPVTVPVLGTITSTMQWAFYYTPSYTVIRSLILNGAASGATVVLKCQGGGCPFVNRTTVLSRGKRCGAKSHGACFSAGTFNLTPTFAGRHLAIGAKLTISITRTNWVGKSYRFTVRARRGPRVQIGCLAPGSGTPGVGCS